VTLHVPCVADTRKFVAHDSDGVLLEDIEAELSRIFVVLSDVHLDSPTVMEKLRVLLGGYAQMDPPPACFVLMGNFFSTPPGNAGGTDRGLASHCFAQLGSLIQEFPALAEETQFVLVVSARPGRCIPCLSLVYPDPVGMARRAVCVCVCVCVSRACVRASAEFVRSRRCPCMIAAGADGPRPVPRARPAPAAATLFHCRSRRGGPAFV
jgi:hypothetical protein